MSSKKPIKTRCFGILPDGERVDEYTLTNPRGLTLKVITYGGIITELHVPDRRGITADVVLGFDQLAGYLGPHPFFGAIIGRVAGRITGGRFTLDGCAYQLAVNDPPNHLHGGPAGFDKRNWTALAVTTADGFPGVQLTRRSPHGEEGYPGNVEVAVTYSLTAENEVVIRYAATTDRATPLSLTHHSYFNLSGEGAGDIGHHQLQIHADAITATDAAMTLLGRRESVAGRPNDLNQPRRLGEVIPKLLNQHGDNYLIRRDHPDALERFRQLCNVHEVGLRPPAVAPNEHLSPARSPFCSADSAKRGEGETLAVAWNHWRQLPSEHDTIYGNTLVPAARLGDPASGRVLEVFTTADCLQFYSAAVLDGTLKGKSGRPYLKHAGLCLECQGYPDGVNTPELGGITLQPGGEYRQTTIYRFTNL